ncbi:hypothetical protein CPLU01_01753 [Colletotrichum plurivorum]|uniref:Uncharacterized protein n=1 Tax=Colletotrichum plurivorum TaxID=2175906 RepID=A0A8H6KYL4_9PEZI|nr:hypothetical protein CPLU01_01753 [Colletotrichum plurivorum]
MALSACCLASVAVGVMLNAYLFPTLNPLGLLIGTASAIQPLSVAGMRPHHRIPVDVTLLDSAGLRATAFPVGARGKGLSNPSIPPITGPGSPQLLPHSGTAISDGGPLTPESQHQLQRSVSQRQRFDTTQYEARCGCNLLMSPMGEPGGKLGRTWCAAVPLKETASTGRRRHRVGLLWLAETQAAAAPWGGIEGVSLHRWAIDRRRGRIDHGKPRKGMLICDGSGHLTTTTDL